MCSVAHASLHPLAELFLNSSLPIRIGSFIVPLQPVLDSFYFVFMCVLPVCVSVLHMSEVPEEGVSLHVSAGDRTLVLW